MVAGHVCFDRGSSSEQSGLQADDLAEQAFVAELEPIDHPGKTASYMVPDEQTLGHDQRSDEWRQWMATLRGLKVWAAVQACCLRLG